MCDRLGQRVISLLLTRVLKGETRNSCSQIESCVHIYISDWRVGREALSTRYAHKEDCYEQRSISNVQVLQQRSCACRVR